jgi:hypothetical protein
LGFSYGDAYEFCAEEGEHSAGQNAPEAEEITWSFRCNS